MTLHLVDDHIRPASDEPRTDKGTFWAAYQRVLAAKSRTLDRSHAAECWRVLDGVIPAELFDAAASRLNATSAFFPSPHDWLAACRFVQREREQAAQVRRLEAAADRKAERTYHCLDCLDSGLVSGIRCTDRDWCGCCRRAGVHLYDHALAMPCGCRDSNPVWQANLAQRQSDAMSSRQKARDEARS